MAFFNLPFRNCRNIFLLPRRLQDYNKVNRAKKTLTCEVLHATRGLHSNGDIKDQILPSTAEIIVAGCGVNGASVAYHLEKLGWKDVLILEQGQAGCGTSWHAAGLCGTLKGTKTQVNIASYGVGLYSKFEDEGKSVGFRKCGSLDFASTKERAINMRRVAALAGECGQEVHILSPKEALRLNPLLNIDNIELALWAPNSGLVNPTDLIQVYLKEAANNGNVQFVEGCEINQIHSNTKKDRVTGITTNLGHVKCDRFINCTGLWARDLGLKSEPVVKIPLHACEHFMFVTKASDEAEVDPMMPVTRDYDGYSYIREWSGGLLCGGFEPNAKATFYKGIPKNFQFQLLEEDLEHCEGLMDSLIYRYPIIGNAEIRSFINGPESFTPDNLPYICKSVEFQNYYIAAGLNSNGITNSAGVGKIIAELITHGESEINSHILDIRRITQSTNNKLFCFDRAAQTLTSVYAQSYPKMISNGDCVKKTALHFLLDGKGAIWGENVSWACPLFFTLADDEKHFSSFGKPSWIKNIQTELSACKNSIGISEHSSKTKFHVNFQEKTSATKFFHHSCPYNDMNLSKNKSVTEMFFHDSKMSLVSMVTIIKESDVSFTMFTEPDQHTFLMTHLLDTAREINIRIDFEDVTGKYALLNLVGPQTENLLNELLSPPFTCENIPDNIYQVVDIGFASDVVLIRQSSNECREWKILVPIEYSQCLYTMILNVGEKYDIKNIGSITHDSLRVQSLRPLYGVEFDTRTDLRLIRDLYVNDEKKESNLSLMQIEIVPRNDDNWVWGCEPVIHDGEYIGRLSTVGYLHGDTKKIMALSILNKNIVDAGSLVSIQVGSDFYEGRITRTG